jgi:hypothetical protein
LDESARSELSLPRLTRYTKTVRLTRFTMQEYEVVIKNSEKFEQCSF